MEDPHLQKLLVLGAGIFQVPIIQRARDLGLYVITADYLPLNIGHKFSNQSINISTTDTESLVSAARDLQIAGVVTLGSDIANRAVAAIAQALYLTGPAPGVVEKTSNKSEFRKFQQRKGLRHPSFERFSEVRDALSYLRQLKGDAVVKPVDSSGSRGIAVVPENNKSESEVVCLRALEFSRCGEICVEEFMLGRDLSGDGMMADGKLKYLCLTKKQKRQMNPTGHILPHDLPDAVVRDVCLEVERTCSELGYMTGPLDFDAILTDRGPTIIELSPRLGGNGIPQLIGRATGFDLLEATIRCAVGQTIDFPSCGPIPTVIQPCASLVFGSERSGTIRNLKSSALVQQSMPAIFDIRYRNAVGDRVDGFIDGSAAIGYVLFDLDSAADYVSVADNILQQMELIVA